MKAKIVNLQILAIIILFSCPAIGTIINVPNEYGSIQHGINAALDGDTVHIEADTYTGAGNRNLSIPFGRNIVIRGEGPDATIIDLHGLSFDGFVFDYTQENNNTIIRDLSVRNGRKGLHLVETGPKLINLKLVNNDWGIYHDTPFGIVNVKHCQFINNDTGIVSYAWSEETFLIDSCKFDSNIYGVFGTVTISNSEITLGSSGIGCDVSSSGPGNKFIANNCNIHSVGDTAIHVGYYSELNDCKIQNNLDMIAHGDVSGIDYARLILADCLIDNNGGGIFVWGDYSGLEFYNSRYFGNGRPIWYIGNTSGWAVIENSYIYGNDSTGLDLSSNGTINLTVKYSVVSAGANGSGIVVNSNFGNINIHSNTITQNDAFGIFVWNAAGDIKIDSNIVNNNTTGIYFNNTPGGFTSVSCNDVYNNSSSNYGGSISDQTGINGNISVPPQFCNFAGGDFHLLPTSPCAPANNSCNAVIGGQGVGCYELQPLVITGYSPLINMIVTDPDGYIIGRGPAGGLIKTLFPSVYVDGPLTDVITIFYPVEGTYTIEVVGQTYAAMRGEYAVGIRIDGTNEAIMTANTPVPDPGESDSYTYEVEEDWHFINGDANRDGLVNILDIIYLINYKYKGGPPPYPLIAGEGNCEDPINILDIVYIINYKYKGGPEPCATLE